jgi:hypothetical protein
MEVLGDEGIRREVCKGAGLNSPMGAMHGRGLACSATFVTLTLKQFLGIRSLIIYFQLQGQYGRCAYPERSIVGFGQTVRALETKHFFLELS